MRLHLRSIVAAFMLAGLIQQRLLAEDFPKPSIYPTSWELKFEHDTPRRIVVEVPGESAPVAYWYLTYTVTNDTDAEQLFLPVFEMLTREGKVLRSDQNIPKKVFDRIKEIEGKQFLEPFTSVGGEIRLGEDEARDGVAIWREPDSRMGTFDIFVQGLSGETQTLRDANGKPLTSPDGKPIILRKSLQLTYQVRGDEVYPGRDSLVERDRRWVMR